MKKIIFLIAKKLGLTNEIKMYRKKGVKIRTKLQIL